MKKVLTSMVLLIFILIPVSVVKASPTVDLAFGTTITEYITSDETDDMYRIQLPSAGRVNLEFTSYIEQVNFYLLDSSNNEAISENVYYGYEQEPKIRNRSINLEPGTYYIKIGKNYYGGYTGRYTLKATFTPANNNEKEPNNGTATAQQLTLNANASTGFLSWNDSVDVYKVVLPNAGRINLQLVSNIYNVDLYLMDSIGNNVIATDVHYGSDQEPLTWSRLVDLEAGTYYIKISRDYYNEYTGKYTLKVGYTAANNNDIEPNNGTTTAQSVTLNANSITGYISWNDSVDVYKIQLPRAGKINVEVSSQIYSVDAYLLNSNGESFISQDIYYGSIETPKVWNPLVDLEAGTYYIKISRENYNEYTGKYTLKVGYTAANNNDIEPNNGTVTAQPISINAGAITGFISWTDSVDVYKFQVSKTARVNISMISKIYRSDVYLLNSNNETIGSADLYYGSEQEPVGWTPQFSLNAGIYYIKVSRNYYSMYTGKYTLSVSSPDILLSGWVQQPNGVWNYYDPQTGVMKTGWLYLGGKWYWLGTDGAMKTGWAYIGSKWYYFDSTGVMKTGWALLGTKRYYFDANGAMKTGWAYIGSKWYYFDSTGVMKTGWAFLGTKWYYFDASGAMKTGWALIGGKWYYFDSNGGMKTGWLQLGTTWYYLNSSGAMVTGWVQLGGKWYYFDNSGAWIK